MADNFMIDGTTLANLVGNRNVYSSDPATSRGAGEIIYQSVAGVLKVNTQTVDPTTDPTWTEVGSGEWVGAATSALDMNGYAITEAAIAGTNAATFKINQDNAGAEASAIEFDRGSVATAARILWSEANDYFLFEEVVSSTLAKIVAGAMVTGDHGTATTDEVVNVCYGTSATPPTVSNTTEGALYIQYTA